MRLVNPTVLPWTSPLERDRTHAMLLRVEKVTKSFDGFVAVQDVELTVAQGQMACIIGPNGAGKSTVFNLITGHLQPTRGKTFFRDRAITGRPPYSICQLGSARR